MTLVHIVPKFIRHQKGNFRLCDYESVLFLRESQSKLQTSGVFPRYGVWTRVHFCVSELFN